DGVAVESDFDGALGGFFAEGGVHAALNDAEESLGLSGLRRDSDWRAKLACPDVDVLAYIHLVFLMAEGCWLTALPRHLALVILKIFFAAGCPAQSHFHRVARAGRIGGVLGAFVERHDDVRAEADLRLDGGLRGEKVRRSDKVRTKGYTFFRDLPQIAKAENLESAGVGENCARPRHESMQTAELANLIDAGAQVKMIGVAEKDLDVELFQQILRDALHRGGGADRHEHRGFDCAVGSMQR